MLFMIFLEKLMAAITAAREESCRGVPCVSEARSESCKKTEMVYANTAQKYLVYLGYAFNYPFRAIVHAIERNFVRLAPTDVTEWVKRGGTVALVALSGYEIFHCTFVVLGLIPNNVLVRLVCGPIFAWAPALLCYSLAMLGKGRIEKIEPDQKDDSVPKQEISVGTINTCLQAPWAPLTGGVVGYKETVGKEGWRVCALADALAKEDLDVILAQECESVAAQHFFIQRLQKNGYRYFYRDLGTNNPILNNSGLFVASRIPLQGAQFVPYPWADRAWILAKGTCQGALGVEVQVNGKRVRLVDVHLNYSSGEANQAARNRQLTKHVMPLAKQDDIPFVVMGDFNFDTTTVRAQECGLEGLKNVVAGQVTCTDEGKHALNGKKKVKDGKPCEDCEERIDAMVPGNGAELSKISVIPMRGANGQLLTDHFLVKAVLKVAS